MGEPNDAEWTSGSVWRHIKTGKVYTVIGRCRLEASGEPAVLYVRPEENTVWARATDQFLDGRFERIIFDGEVSK